MRARPFALVTLVVAAAALPACGARTGLRESEEQPSPVFTTGSGPTSTSDDGTSSEQSTTTTGEDSTSTTSTADPCDVPEVCNGVDDDCDGLVDSDCEVGGCNPALVVIDVVKSSPRCFVDSVQPGSAGEISYACEGGPVSAMFGPILFTGDVSGGEASLEASTTFDWVDGCKWGSFQTITGKIGSGTLDYTYAEMPILGSGCLPPCSATGTIAVVWAP